MHKAHKSLIRFLALLALFSLAPKAWSDVLLDHPRSRNMA